MSSIVEMLQESSRRHAGKTALRHKVCGEWNEISYQDIWSASDRIAAGLSEWGLKGGERAALLAPSSPAWVMSYFGILKNNSIAVPVDKELKQKELRHVLADCGARILFTEQSYLELVFDAAENLPELEKIVLMNQPPDVGRLLPAEAERVLESLVSEWQRLSRHYRIEKSDAKNFEELAENYHDLLTHAATDPVNGKRSLFSGLLRAHGEEKPGLLVESVDDFQSDAPPPALRCRGSDPAVILYTSGTTGRSKGAMLSHDNVASNVRTAIQLFDLDSSMHTLSFLPINHVFEQVAGIILPLAVGGTVSFAESLRKIGDNLGEVKPNFMLGVPAVFRLLADRMYRKVSANPLTRALFSFGPTRSLVTKKVRAAFGGNPVFVSGGAALDPAVASMLTNLGLNVYQGYGITETSPVIAVETPSAKRLGTVGLPIPGVDVKIYRPNAEGVGEIWVRGPNVMLGYYNNPTATSEVLTEGWYHTGDLGRLEADGFLSICGRLKNLIVTANGKNVYPEEVENELSNSPFIAEIMVYGHRLGDGSEEVHAMVYPDHEAIDAHALKLGKGPFGQQETEELIRVELLERGSQLADYKRVKRFTLRNEEFPKTTTRKIKRFVMEADIDAVKQDSANRA